MMRHLEAIPVVTGRHDASIPVLTVRHDEPQLVYPHNRPRRRKFYSKILIFFSDYPMTNLHCI